MVRALALLDLPEGVQDRVERGDLAPATACEIGKFPDPGDQAELAQTVLDQKLTRSEVAEAVQAVRARRPAPVARPEPATFNLGEAGVTIRWKKAGISAVQALRRALKEVQERERAGEAEDERGAA